jgi:hypothetical protein
MKRLLLIYQGYPRLSQTYMVDEAEELSKHYELMIASLVWPLYVPTDSALPYKYYRKFQDAVSDIDNFRPDFIHGHFMTNASLLLSLAQKHGCNFTVRTHSFDVLTDANLRNRQLITALNNPRCKLIYCFPAFLSRLTSAGVDATKIVTTYPSIRIMRYFDTSTNGPDIISGGAMLSKKNITGFIDLAEKIKARWPTRMVRFYSVPENPDYWHHLTEYNRQRGSPVEFITVQPSRMKEEYKRHKYLIYGSCPVENAVGYPLMICEAQAAGVIAIGLNLRPETSDYISSAGYMCNSHDEVLQILESDLPEDEKREAGFSLVNRYNIETNINLLLDTINNNVAP